MPDKPAVIELGNVKKADVDRANTVELKSSVDNVDRPALKKTRSALNIERSFLEDRKGVLHALRKTNDVYLNHLVELRKESGKRDITRAVDLQRQFCGDFTKLERKDNMWEKNKDPFEQLREAIARRHEILDELVKKAQQCVDEQKEQKPVEHLREDSERLFAKLEKMNTKITALEIRNRSEQQALQKIVDIFDNSCTNPAKKMTIDEFGEFFEDRLGCEFERRKYELFREEVKFNEVPVDQIDSEVFASFLRLQYGITPDEAIFAIRERDTFAEFANRKNWRIARMCLFFLLMIFIILVMLAQYGGADRYWQSEGVRQTLVGTVWNDIQFPDINSVGLFWMYFLEIVIPFAYGYQEFRPNGFSNTYAEDIFNKTHIDPYVLGGIQIRQVRFKPKECESPADKTIFACLSENADESSTLVRWEDVPGIGPIPWKSYEELDESRRFLAKTKPLGFSGSGYTVYLPPQTTMDTCQTVSECEMCSKYVLLDGADTSTLPFQMCNASRIVTELRDKFFIDAQTRGLFIDMLLFNPSSRMHTVVRMLFEFRFGFVYPGQYVTTWFIFLYESDRNIVLLVFLVIFAFLFTGTHLVSCFRYMNTLGYPWCFTPCIEEDLTPEEAKLPARVRNYQLEKLDGDDDVSFVSMDPSDEKDGSMVISIPIDGVNPLKIQQKQEVVKSSVETCIALYIEEQSEKLTESARTADLGYEYMDVNSTSWGGTILKLKVVGGERLWDGFQDGETIEKERADLLRSIGEEIELDLKEIKGCEEVNVLYSMEPRLHERVLGLGILTFYYDFFNALDLVFIFMLWLYLGLHMKGNYDIDYERHLQVGEWVSFRQIHNYLTMEVNVLAGVIFFAALKLLEYLMEVNRQVRLFFRMLRHSIKVLLSFMLLLLFIVFMFSFSGWLVFSSEVWGFRSLSRTFVSMWQWIMDDLPYEDIRQASVLGTPYYFFWLLALNLIFLNILIAILLNSWDTVMEEAENEKRAETWFPHIRYLMGYKTVQRNPKEDWIQDPAQWRRLYPAGCPERRLKDYLRSQLDLNQEDCDEIMQLIDVDNSGTIDWQELSTMLIDLKPNLQNRTFIMRRKQTQQILESQGRLQEDLNELEKSLEYDSMDGKLNHITKLCQGLLEEEK